MGGLIQEGIPQYSVEDIKCMLDELSGAAEIVEVSGPNSLSIPTKERLINLAVIVAAVILMAFVIKVFILEALSKIH